MSSATHVPETVGRDDLDISDARAALRRAGAWPLVRDSYGRFRYGDGFTSSRALALQLCLAIVPLVLSLEGLSSVLLHGDSRVVLSQTLIHLTPVGSSQGTVQQLLSNMTQTTQGAGGLLALVFGLLTAVVSLSTAFAQIQRGANRIYGIQRDRPTVRRYVHATVLSWTVGLLASVAFALMVAGGPFADAMRGTGHWNSDAVTIWNVARWPVGAVLAVLAITLLFDHAPRRHQPSRSWLGVGAGVSVVLWIGFTLLLALYVSKSATFGSVYGPLTWVVALLLWALLTSVALFLGLALAAQLEAVRAGVAEPALSDDDDHDVVVTRVPKGTLVPVTASVPAQDRAQVSPYGSPERVAARRAAAEHGPGRHAR